MNQKYIVKRNAHGQSVVCSEKTKARGKVKSIVLAVATASAMMASVGVVAATATGTGITGTVGNVALDGDTAGNLAITSTGTVTATGGNSIAIGYNVTTKGAHTTAMGENLFVSDKIKNATVIGRDMSFNSSEWKMINVDGLTVVGNQNRIKGGNGGAPSIHHVHFFGDNNYIGGGGGGISAENLTVVGSFSGVDESFSINNVENAAILGTGSRYIPNGNTSGQYMLIAGHNSSVTLDDIWNDSVTENVTVIGHHSKINNQNPSFDLNADVSVDNTTIIGNKNDVGTTNTLVLGNNVTETIGMDVVLGNDSASYELGTATAGRADYPSYTIKDTTYTFAGTTPHNIISVGATGKEGRIQNVASGLISATSTDAINGSQLYAVTEALKAIQAINPYDITDVITTEVNVTGGDNVQVNREGNNFTISATDTNTQSSSSVVDGKGLAITATDNANGTKNYAFEAKIGDGLVFGDNGEIKATGTALTAGDNITVEGDATNGYTIKATDTNTQSSASVVDGKGLTVTATDNANGTKNYAFETKIGDGLVFGDNGEIKATGTALTAGDNITVEGDATSGYTIQATNTQSVVKAGNGVTVDVADNDIGTKDYTVSTKIGDGLTFGDNGEIKATGTIINAGDNITVTGDAINGYTISTKGGITDEQLQDVINQINGIVDTNTQSTTSSGQGIVITETDNANGTKNYAVSIKASDGLTFDDKGNIRVSDTLVKAGDNVQVSGNAKDGFTVSAKSTEITAGDNVNVSGDANNGYTISVDNMRTTVTGGQGAEVASSDNADGSKNYTVNVKVGEGLTYDDKGNIVNDMKLTAGDNVQVSGDAKGGYTISATDTNTQATVSADKGITITETDNANGTKNYAVSAKLGKGLKVDENGAIAATAQPINGSAGVTITTNAQDEAVVNVAGVTTTTDDGKSYTRSDLTKPVGVKGDGKNIRTSTTANGDVQVKLADDIQVNSVSINNGPTINQQGINAANTRITNVQDGVAPTDAVNVRQLHQQGNVINKRIDNLANNVKKNKKRNDAGIASTAAMANIPQVMLAGKSGVGVGVGHRSGQSAIAVGYSRASDNAKHIIKLSAGLDTQSKATFGAGYMYQW